MEPKQDVSEPTAHIKNHLPPTKPPPPPPPFIPKNRAMQCPPPPFLPLPSPQLLACFAPIANTRNGGSLPSPFPTVLFLVSERIITHSSHSRYPKTSPPPPFSAMESRFSPGAASHRHDMFCINVPQINGRLHQFILRLSSLGETQSSHIKLRRRRTGASVLPGGAAAQEV